MVTALTELLIDRAAIFSAILARQQLRREARLPLLDVRAVYEREIEQAIWRDHVRRHYETVRSEVVARYRAKHGPTWGLSAGGRWLIEAETRRSLREMLTVQR